VRLPKRRSSVTLIARASVLLVAGTFALSAATAGSARTPLPATPQGSGTTPTAGTGSLGDRNFSAATAIAFTDGYGDINVFLFERPHPCDVVSFDDAPYIWVYIHTEGTRLPVGTAVTPGKKDRLLVSVPANKKYVNLNTGVKLTLTRIDTSANGLWHGRLQVATQAPDGLSYRYDGTFAARWCGTQ